MMDPGSRFMVPEEGEEEAKEEEEEEEGARVTIRNFRNYGN